MHSPWMAFIGAVGVSLACTMTAQATHRSEPAAETQPASPAAALDDPWSSPAVAAPNMSNDDIVRRPAARPVSGAPTGGPSTGLAWLRTTGSLAGVVALIVLLAWGYRLATGTGGRLALKGRARHSSVIETLGRVNLSPRQALHLVRVGPQVILIGATHDSLRTLSVIQDAELAARLAGQTGGSTSAAQPAAFQKWLENNAAEYERGSDAQGGADDDERTNRNDLTHRLGRTLKRLRAAAQGTSPA